MLAHTEHYYTPVHLDDDYILKPRNEERARLPLGSLPDRAIVGLPSRITCTTFAKDLHVEEPSDAIGTDGPAVTSLRNRRRPRNGKATSAAAGSRTEVYQSITCLQGIGDKSFEELRLECYRQSMIATGRPPQPVHRWIVIPPAFTPSHVQEQRLSSGPKDVIMSAEPLLTSAFTFSTPPFRAQSSESGVVDETSNIGPEK